ncbi:MAG: PstS family phosphate ABC transporter substrate-binding protein [Dermatophilaceae bacterium]|nr:PstS family phosphate ABC transporter substrate-binding protein [Intrasporangiaceae bacterium]
MTIRTTKTAGIGAAMLLTLALAACGGSDTTDTTDSTAGSTEEGSSELSGAIVIDGSSTVAPLSEAAAELFMQANPGVNVTVGTSGTGGGFEKFCRGESEISNASREIKDSEIELCAENDIAYEKVNVSNDGLAVVVHPENDWAQCMTVEELNMMWGPDATATSWQEINPEFPDEEFKLYGPGSDSGTYDYFTEAINGEEGVIRAGYSDIGEDDNAAVTGVSGDVNAMAFVPLSFVLEAGDKVRAIELENEAGDCVAPSEETVQDTSYNPLGRQLYVYPSDLALQKPEVVEFLSFYLENNEEITEAAGFIPLTDEQKAESQALVDALAGG